MNLRFILITQLIIELIMSTKQTELYIENYTPKSFVIRGDTRPHRESLKALGGKWANRLTDKDTGEKFGAWLFWSAKNAELDKWIKGGCKAIQGSHKEVPTYDISSRIRAIETSIAKLEKMTQAIYRCVIDGEIVEEEEEEEDIKPHKRLL